MKNTLVISSNMHTIIKKLTKNINLIFIKILTIIIKLFSLINDIIKVYFFIWEKYKFNEKILLCVIIIHKILTIILLITLSPLFLFINFLYLNTKIKNIIFLCFLIIWFIHIFFNNSFMVTILYIFGYFLTGYYWWNIIKNMNLKQKLIAYYIENKTLFDSNNYWTQIFIYIRYICSLILNHLITVPKYLLIFIQNYDKK